MQTTPGAFLVRAVLSLPRLIRILIAGVFALATVLAVSPIVDEIYLLFFYSPATALVPSLISAALGVMMYLIGWQMIVGTVGEPKRAPRGVLWYFGIGLFALLIVGLWLLRLALTNNVS
ncbi:MAG: hypothetical protein OHK0046_07310 [Anaerolineae bacterium]